MTRVVLSAFACFFVIGSGVAQTSPPALSGTWVLKTDPSVKLVVEQTPDKIHVQEFRGDQVLTEFTCNTVGKDCEIKDEGHPAKVALWFNGPKLIELRTKGNEVTRRRFTLAADGHSLEVERSAMSADGKTEVLAYSR
ncbi:MAG TPA: hypothetical protein VKB79_29205 [Bryobacteraceae bacterium]|nr:hypothetical protein [Bryobacteraceae bacterium]